MTNHNHSKPSIGESIVYRTRSNDIVPPQAGDGRLSCRSATRSLVGMQKEALVASSASPTVWRLVCDEGPYLNGTDLAPPPLGFFSAGMTSCYADALIAAAADAGTIVDRLQIVLDNHYSMEGSAIRGTMVGGAMPVEISVDATLADSAVDVAGIARDAVDRCVMEGLMRSELVDTFTITHNGKPIPTVKVAGCAAPIPADPVSLFESVDSGEMPMSPVAAIEKIEGAASVFDETHGSGASMKETQKRRLLVRSILDLRPDGLRDIRMQLFKPIGSVFGFLAGPQDSGGEAQAPSGLVLASAGLAFCFMTQIGRYAGIVKKDLADYGIVQDTVFDLAGGMTLPVETHSYITSSEDRESVQRYIDMSEQTCFLHAACRLSNASKLSIA